MPPSSSSNPPTEVDTGYLRLPRRRVVACAVAAYVVLACVDAPATFLYGLNLGLHDTWAYDVAVTAPGWLVRCLLLPIPLLLTERFPLVRGRGLRHLPAHLAGGTACAAGWVLLGSLLSDRVLLPWLGNPPLTVGYWSHAVTLFASSYCSELGMYGLLAGALHAVHFSRLAVERERAAGELALRASRLETSLAQANLGALSMQLRPHFLFNTLNAVTVLAMKGRTADVVRVLGWLSALLRASLATDAQRIPLARELRFARRYLAIEQVRFGPRLRVRFRVQRGAGEAEVPSFLLQPLVENAIRHGIARRRDGGRVRVAARRVGERLELTVSDNGPGFGASRRTTGTGLGLANTRARLEQHYGPAFEMHSASGPSGGATVRVVLPFRTAAKQEAAVFPRERTNAA